MNDIAYKYSLLNSSAQKEVIEFIEYLLSKNTKKSQNGLSDYKKKILNVSVWSSAEIDELTTNQHNSAQWSVPEW